MFPPMHIDAEYNDDGTLRKPGQDYYLKPMNCPMHCLIFRSRGRSYRELPLRLFEFGTVYRYELSGVVHGLTRVRGLTMDDAHIYCTRDQMRDELTSLLRFVLDLLGDYGLTDFYLELSTKDPNKFVGSDELWEEATSVLAEVGVASGLDLVPDPGGAAFYGPKISVQVKDALGRSWQMSTIQLDFNFPERFELEYTAADGSRQRPVMIHRALFGSIERFFGILTEHYAGAFPAWLAPVQVVGIPVADDHIPYLNGVATQLKMHGIRAEVDTSDDRMAKKIVNHTNQKVPFMLLAGDRDVEAGAVSFRFGDRSQVNGVPRDEAVEAIVNWIASRENASPDSRTAQGGHRDVKDDVTGDERLREEPTAKSDERTIVDHGVGEPDHLQRLWTPHRMNYIAEAPLRRDNSAESQPFTDIPTLSDEDGLVVARGEIGLRRAQSLPVQPGPPDGGAVSAGVRTRRPHRRRECRADGVHPEGDSRHQERLAPDGFQRRAQPRHGVRWLAGRTPAHACRAALDRRRELHHHHRRRQGHPAAAARDPSTAGDRVGEAAVSDFYLMTRAAYAKLSPAGRQGRAAGRPHAGQHHDRRHRGRGDRRADAVPDRAAVVGLGGGLVLRAGRHARRRDGARDAAAAPGSVPCWTRPVTGSATARCSAGCCGGRRSASKVRRWWWPR